MKIKFRFLVFGKKVTNKICRISFVFWGLSESDAKYFEMMIQSSAFVHLQRLQRPILHTVVGNVGHGQCSLCIIGRNEKQSPNSRVNQRHRAHYTRFDTNERIVSGAQIRKNRTFKSNRLWLLRFFQLLLCNRFDCGRNGMHWKHWVRITGFDCDHFVLVSNQSRMTTTRSNQFEQLLPVPSEHIQITRLEQFFGQTVRHTNRNRIERRKKLEKEVISIKILF